MQSLIILNHNSSYISIYSSSITCLYALFLKVQKKKQENGTRLSRPSFSGIPEVYTPLRGASRCSRDVKKLGEVYAPLRDASNSRSLRLPFTSLSANSCNAQRKRMGPQKQTTKSILKVCFLRAISCSRAAKK